MSVKGFKVKVGVDEHIEKYDIDSLVKDLTITKKSNYYINTNNNEVESDKFDIVGFIPVVPTQSIKLYKPFATGATNGIVAWWYNASKVYVGRTASTSPSGTLGSYTVTVPDNAAFVRYNIAKQLTADAKIEALGITTTVDETLSLSGLPADAKTVGDAINEINSNFIVEMLPNNTDLDNVVETGLYLVPASYNISHRPDTSTCFMEVWNASNGYVIQRYSTLMNTEDVYIRRKASGANWGAWVWSENSPQLVNGSDLDNITHPGSYVVPSSYTIANRPDSRTSILEVISSDGSYFVQRYSPVNVGAPVFTRRYANGEWGGWYSIKDSRFTVTILENNTDLNNLVDTGFYVVPASYTIANRPNDDTCFLEVYGASNGYVVQRYSTLTYTEKVYIRRKASGANWSAWTWSGNAVQLSTNTDLDDLVNTGSYIVPSSYVILNRPDSRTSVLEVISNFGIYVVQRYTPLTTGASIYMRRLANEEWGDWFPVSSAGEVIQNYEFVNNQYTQTINASPSLQVNSEYYLEASSNPSTDRTAEIIALLNTNGYCKLGKGTFTVSNLTMPDNSKLEGSGFGTILKLADDVQSGYAISVRNYCLLSDLKISGGESSYKNSESAGNRNGIAFQGTWSGQAEDDPFNVPRNSSINNVFVEKFSGAGLVCQYSGTASVAALTVNDIWISDCYYGINIFERSEYSHFTNCKLLSNNIGLVNNGGNNFFANCDISRNNIGVIMDSLDGTRYNDTHGSMVGCSINHNYGANSDAIIIKGGQHGYVFEACNIFFGNIRIENSKGIAFIGLNAGSMYHIDVKDSKSILFINCLFNSIPAEHSIINSTRVVCKDCYHRTTGEEITLTE